MSLVAINRTLCKEVERLRFAAPVAHVYNPLLYARKPHEMYLDKFGGAHKEVVLLGMNPGPWGMAQTGVPFGEVAAVRDWMNIDAPVGKPRNEHPKRLVTGFACTRSEVSGRRVWGWAQERFGTPEKFFERFFVVNYCPLAFLEDSGRNRTPNKLPAAEKESLTRACDHALRKTIATLRPSHVLGVGIYARDCATRALADFDLEIGHILHPSPASPKANRGWARLAEEDIIAAGIHL